MQTDCRRRWRHSSGSGGDLRVPVSARPPCGSVPVRSEPVACALTPHGRDAEASHVRRTPPSSEHPPKCACHEQERQGWCPPRRRAARTACRRPPAPRSPRPLRRLPSQRPRRLAYPRTALTRLRTRSRVTVSPVSPTQCREWVGLAVWLRPDGHQMRRSVTSWPTARAFATKRCVTRSAGSARTKICRECRSSGGGPAANPASKSRSAIVTSHPNPLLCRYTTSPRLACCERRRSERLSERIDAALGGRFPQTRPEGRGTQARSGRTLASPRGHHR
jgi:hypothetical protein